MIWRDPKYLSEKNIIFWIFYNIKYTENVTPNVIKLLHSYCVTVIILFDNGSYYMNLIHRYRATGCGVDWSLWSVSSRWIRVYRKLCRPDDAKGTILSCIFIMSTYSSEDNLHIGGKGGCFSKFIIFAPTGVSGLAPTPDGQSYRGRCGYAGRRDHSVSTGSGSHLNTPGGIPHLKGLFHLLMQGFISLSIFDWLIDCALFCVTFRNISLI